MAVSHIALCTIGLASTRTPADATIALQIAAGGSASCDPTTLAAADVSGAMAASHPWARS